MSSINQGRIKQIRKRSNGSFPTTGIPIGTDGILVDMISQLDLEEEIRLGGNHYVDIVETNTATIIKEWYFSEARGSRSLEQMSPYVTYSASVNIISAIENNLAQSSNDGVFVTYIERDEQEQEVSHGDFIVDREAIASNAERIQMNLYRYDMDSQDGVLIHSKTIYITESLTGEIGIDEQVDYSGDVTPIIDDGGSTPIPEPGEDENENENNNENEGNENNNENPGEQEVTEP